nr:MetaGeneMark_Unknown Function [uncultured bacterium]
MLISGGLVIPPRPGETAEPFLPDI